MATSSILDNIEIRNPQAIEDFLSTMEGRTDTSKRQVADPSYLEADPEKMDIFSRRVIDRFLLGF